MEIEIGQLKHPVAESGSSLKHGTPIVHEYSTVPYVGSSYIEVDHTLPEWFPTTKFEVLKPMTNKIIITYKNAPLGEWGTDKYMIFDKVSQAKTFCECLTEDGRQFQLWAAEPINYATFLSMNSDGTTN